MKADIVMAVLVGFALGIVVTTIFYWPPMPRNKQGANGIEIPLTDHEIVEYWYPSK
jgi:hypothetical protein